MSRRNWFVPFLIILMVATTWARPLSIKDTEYYRTAGIDATKTQAIISSNTEVNPQNVYNGPMRDNPADVAVGEEMIIGYTWYDYQHNGSIGNMIRHDSQGYTHFIWMRGYNSNNNPRHAVYNYLTPDGALDNDPAEEENDNQVDAGTNSGYTCMDILPADQRAIGFYHVRGHVEDDPAYVGTGQSTDWGYSMGAFQSSHPSSWPDIQLIWPHGAVDQQNRSHIIATEYRGEDEDAPMWQRVGYWTGSPDDDFLNWGWNADLNGMPVNVDTTGAITAVAAASPQSNKVALAWHHNRVGTEMLQPNGDWELARGGWQRNNDIRYIIDEDGQNWDWDNGIQSMTKILPVIPELAEVNMISARGDTFRPYCDVDIEFDPWDGQDNLYGVFAASGFQEKPIPDALDPAPVDVVYAVMGHLWFWNSEQDTLTMIYDGWYNQYMSNPATEGRFRPGGWRLNADRGSIAFDPENPGHIYVVWVLFPEIQDMDGVEFYEGAQDTSEQGYLSADIMVSRSIDYGITWREPINVTETIWDGDRAPEPGDCQSEAWASCDPIASEGKLHIFYIRDTDAGGLPQEEGTATNSPMIYHTIDLEDLVLNEPVAMPRNDFMFHNYPNYAPVIDEVIRAVGTPRPDQNVAVSANVSPTGGREVVTVYLEYHIPGAADIMQIEMDADGENFFATIPGQADGTYVWYRIHAIDNEDGETTYPNPHWYSYIVRPEGGMTIHDIQYPGPREWGVDYSPFKDVLVTVEGIVTTPMDFAETYDGFAIQDAEGYWSGVFVRGDHTGYEPGSRVQVTGVVRERDDNNVDKWRYLTYIEASEESVMVLEEDVPLPEPMYVPYLRSIATMAEYAEHLEGVLVRVWSVKIGDPTSVDSVYRSLYIPIVKAFGEGEDRVDEIAFITTHGLDEGTIEALELDRPREGDPLDFITGIFMENQDYALAPLDMSAFDEFSAPMDEKQYPQKIKLDSAYPNPFNGITKIGFDLAKSDAVKIAIYDLSGRMVQTVLEGNMQAGHHNLALNAEALATGMYILRLSTPTEALTQKLVLVK